MKIANNNQQEEYREFLKHIREERQGSSNFAKLLFTIVLAILCAVIVCVTILENSYFLNKIPAEQAESNGFFKFVRKKNNFHLLYPMKNH